MMIRLNKRTAPGPCDFLYAGGSIYISNRDLDQKLYLSNNLFINKTFKLKFKKLIGSTADVYNINIYKH